MNRARLTLVALAVALVAVSAYAYAEAPATKTVAALYQEKAQLKGHKVQVRGKVVKVNNNIMQRNFLHVQDGSGTAGTNDLTITSDQTAQIGDEVVVTGMVTVDKDFGAGYVYPLLLEQAAVTPAGK